MPNRRNVPAAPGKSPQHESAGQPAADARQPAVAKQPAANGCQPGDEGEPAASAPDDDATTGRFFKTHYYIYRTFISFILKFFQIVNFPYIFKLFSQKQVNYLF